MCKVYLRINCPLHLIQYSSACPKLQMNDLMIEGMNAEILVQSKRAEPEASNLQAPVSSQSSHTNSMSDSITPITPQQMIPQATAEPPSTGRPQQVPIYSFSAENARDPLPERVQPQVTPFSLVYALMYSRPYVLSDVQITVPYCTTLCT